MLQTVHNTIKPVHDLESTLSGLKQIIVKRIKAFGAKKDILSYDWLEEVVADSEFKDFLLTRMPELRNEDIVILLLALVPHLQPNFFESIIFEELPNGGDFPEFGGVKASNHRGMLPTGETAQFILAGNDIQKRLRVQMAFGEEHLFHKLGVLYLEPVKEGEPVMSGRIVISQEWLEKIIFGKDWTPRFGIDFPAKQITTSMIWDDVVLHPRTLSQVKDISNWLEHHPKVMEDENLRRKVKPGYRVLFYGPSGTGKTLTAGLLGKQFNKDVYRIDLSQIVSKFIGETEKNLESVFKKAENKNWILFFDEADALFGKRTNVQSAHDKYANQEVSYLLQRVEDYNGLLILASNFKNNLDDAFIRRFHSVVHFPMPNAHERYLLWEKSLPEALKIDKAIDLEQLADKYELSGASILNAIHFAALQCYSRNDSTMYQTDIIEGIKKEFLKEEKTI